MIQAFPKLGLFMRDLLSDSVRRFQISLLLLVVLIGFGTAGYHLVEDMGLIDALYMTLITITTVGFQEVHPLSQGGKIFTMGLITLGVGTAAWALSNGVEVVLGENLWVSMHRRRLEQGRMVIKDHYIICGYGRMGRQIAQDLKIRDEEFVIVELSPAAEEILIERGIPHVIGDAEQDAVLKHAGIDRARGLVAALDTDAANVLTVLTARELNPDLLIVARAMNESAEAKLRRAGADRVVSPDAIGGHRLALALLQPRVHDFLSKVLNIEELDVDMGQILIGPRSILAGQTVADTNMRERWNVTILAIQSASGEFIISPDAHRVIQPEETLIVIGPLDAIRNIEQRKIGES